MEGCSCCPGRRKRGKDGGQGDTERVEEMRPLITPHSHTPDLLPRKDYESLDYDRCFNKPYEAYTEEFLQKQSAAKLALTKWIVTFLVGFLTGMVALFIDYVVKKLSKIKFSAVEGSILTCYEDGCLVMSLLYLLLFNVGFVIIASTLVVIEPIAGGSGIPEIKCYLNGVKVPRVGRLLTLVSKSVGVLFSVAGGLFVGKEGPMIHSGAIIGAGVPQFQSIAFKKVNLKKYSFFRTDRDKRDFVSGGAAAGVAAAFGAPIGGVLFSLEEGCSFWNQKLTWRTFFCSMAATYTLNFFLSGIETNSWGYFYLPGLINFGVFKCANESGIGCRLWDITDLAIFVVMGFVGGLMGALFNAINNAITKHRMKHVQRKHNVMRILEAALVAAVTTSVAFGASIVLGECTEITQSVLLVNATSRAIDDTVRTYFCPNGSYNDMATLFFNSQEEAIKQLFHQPETDGFSLRTLGIFLVCFFLLACWTYGASVPSGLFVPCLLCGAAYGRFVARLLVLMGYGNQAIHSGTFALVGAAAFLGGVVRMTISLTVILIESTNEISYGLPLMLVLMVAKWSGDLFNEGLYDIHIKLRGVPLLEWEVPSGMERLKARDIMKRELHFLYPRTRVTSIIRILRTTAHNAFPVVSVIVDHAFEDVDSSSLSCDPTIPLEDGFPRNARLRMDGLILRSQLVMLLKEGAMFDEGQTDRSRPSLSYEEMTKDYPRFPDIYDITRSQSLPQSKIVDVVPYMNPCPYTVYPNTPVPQVFNLFRSMGLRHLPVVSHEGQVLGMVTRHNLTHEFLESCLEDLDNCGDHHS